MLSLRRKSSVGSQTGALPDAQPFTSAEVPASASFASHANAENRHKKYQCMMRVGPVEDKKADGGIDCTRCLIAYRGPVLAISVT